MSQRILTPDYILQEALAAHGTALTSYLQDKGVTTAVPKSQNENDGGLTLTVLGCGTMGIAILGGILGSLSDATTSSTSKDTISEQATPDRLPSRFNACVRSAASAQRIHAELGHLAKFASVKVCQDDTLEPVQQADIVLLCCKPHMVSEILTQPGIAQALAGKLVISICVGLDSKQIASMLPPSVEDKPHCTIACAMPNTAAAVRESMTIISKSVPPLPASTEALVTWIFSRIGRVSYIAPNLMPVSAALCGSGPAFVAVVVESLAAGAIAMGLPREDAYTMAAQMMRGTTGLLLRGEHPALLRDKVSTPGGCTVRGLVVLEEGGVRGTVARAVRETTVAATPVQKHKAHVNVPAA
ncbi:hypothetical protein LTR62_002836 [Meristemomyces frigidus]|uniref:Pyrroline-5-carboxylate reductase n=1 Tax=Meristemomyces frigidus TaxID=1508187 RepID=A0AAN7TXQ3_9PEZI|nr:hypothetical protein LTR62_002836 [Meristemomyces frigidus]